MEQAERQYRKCLPVPMYRNEFTSWQVLKNCIGKELTTIAMPVVYNEPLSFLQRLAEYMEYAYLLRKAAEQEDPIERLQLVIGFAVSALASNWDRLGKPFNPLLGETFELKRAEFKMVCEQVSHHPPVSAFHAEGEGWVFHGSIHPKLSFWGKNVEIQPQGVITVEFPKLKEAYWWSNVKCIVHNIIVGKLWMEQIGKMEINSYSSDIKAYLHFKAATGNNKELHKVEGFITNKANEKLLFVYGKWSDYVKVTDLDSFDEYVRAHPLQFAGLSETKSPGASPSRSSKKVLQKLNSLKVSSLNKSQSTSEDVSLQEMRDNAICQNHHTYFIEIPNSTLIWESDGRPDHSSDYYNFTNFAMSLNEIEKNEPLCPTDSRLRPDIRKLEKGDIEGAATEKTRLEEKQRDANKSRKSKKSPEWTPRWFCLGVNPYTKQEDWMYNGNYWNRQYTDPDIF
ncbi:oxysterol-binding protein-related protein 1 [Diabrotica undecimpunctata]|uniref:oxysterol-binding protein-related protein 1 n=1 Tax=Diabrotica undecimpunctata TaxID=50387 RepID=UPI003B63C7BF